MNHQAAIYYMKHTESWRKQDYHQRVVTSFVLSLFQHTKKKHESENVIFFNMSFHQLLLLRQHQMTKKKLCEHKGLRSES